MRKVLVGILLIASASSTFASECKLIAMPDFEDGILPGLIGHQRVLRANSIGSCIEFGKKFLEETFDRTDTSGLIRDYTQYTGTFRKVKFVYDSGNYQIKGTIGKDL